MVQVGENEEKQIATDIQGVPKKISLQLMFECLTLGGVLLGVENNSKNFLFYKFFWVAQFFQGHPVEYYLLMKHAWDESAQQDTC